ncbi:MAG: recombinase family protein [Bacilli bacterium]|nr:recombinase family protein [Bacilli bacterium]
MGNDEIAKIRNDLRKYVIYSRKSKFTGKGESVENQIEICKAYIKSKFDINVKDEDIIIKQDEGFSGKDVKRPQFQEMMSLVKEKQVKMIVVYKLDRLSRNVLDFCEMYNELEQYDTKFASVSESFDTTTSMGRAMLMITMTFAQLERETIAERIRDNMMELAKTGRWLGGNTPMGFESEKMEKFNINGKKVSLYKLSPINDEIEIIKLIYDKYLELKSLTTLETFLLNNNLKTRRECDFARWGLKKILTNPVYAIADKDMFNYFKNNDMDIFNDEIDWDGTYGVMSYNKTSKTKTGSVKTKDKDQWINAIGKHQGIIKGKDWVEVQRLLNSNQNKAYRLPVKNNSILAGILRCEHCGNLMRPKLKDTTLPNGDRKFNYICDLKMRSRGKLCNCPNVNGNEADKLVIDGIKELAKPTSEFYQELLKVIKDENYGKNSQTNELEVLERKHNQNLASIKNYISRIEYVDEDLLDDVQNKIKDLKQKDKEVVAKIQELKADQPDSYTDQETAKMLVYILDNYMSNFTELDLLSQRNFLKLFIGNCSTDGKDIHIDLIGSRNHTTTYQPVFEGSENSETGTHGGQIVLLSDSGE